MTFYELMVYFNNCEDYEDNVTGHNAYGYYLTLEHAKEALKNVDLQLILDKYTAYMWHDEISDYTERNDPDDRPDMKRIFESDPGYFFLEILEHKTEDEIGGIKNE